MIYIEENCEICDNYAENNDKWSAPVTGEIIRQAKKGIWEIALTPTKPVPKDWFPDSLNDKKILCLASGGGWQGPILAALGADVTVYDNVKKQLEMDEFVANRDNLRIKTVQGNIQDLSVFEDERFDCIIHPWSNGCINYARPVWKECARVLKKNGLLLTGFGYTIPYILEVDKLGDGVLRVKNNIPDTDMEHMEDMEIEAIAEEDGSIWSHTLEVRIQGQIEAGFAIVGFYKDICRNVLDQYRSAFIATKAVKLQ